MENICRIHVVWIQPIRCLIHDIFRKRIGEPLADTMLQTVRHEHAGIFRRALSHASKSSSVYGYVLKNKYVASNLNLLENAATLPYVLFSAWSSMTMFPIWEFPSLFCPGRRKPPSSFRRKQVPPDWERFGRDRYAWECSSRISVRTIGSIGRNRYALY